MELAPVLQESQTSEWGPRLSPGGGLCSPGQAPYPDHGLITPGTHGEEGAEDASLGAWTAGMTSALWGGRWDTACPAEPRPLTGGMRLPICRLF